MAIPFRILLSFFVCIVYASECVSVRISSISSNPRQAFRIPNIYSELWSWNTSAQWATVLVLRDISSLHSALLPYLAYTLSSSAERAIVIVRDYTLYSCVSFFSYFLLSLLLSLLIAVAGRLFFIAFVVDCICFTVHFGYFFLRTSFFRCTAARAEKASR